MDQLSKRVVLVTGSTGGLGTAICKKLYDSNCRVVANHRNVEKAKEWQEQMKTEGYEIDIFEGDVADFDSVKNMIINIEEKIGPIDVLVNNAGITKDCRFSKMTKEDWENVLSTNLTGVF